LCIEVNQEVEGPKAELSLPLSSSVSAALSGLGVEVVEPGGSCEATLRIDLVGHMLGGIYEQMYKQDLYCWNGVKVNGQMALTAPGHDPLTYSLDYEKKLPNSVSEQACNEDVSEGLAALLGPGSPLPTFILRGLDAIWGERVYVWALNDPDYLQRKAEFDLNTRNFYKNGEGSEQSDQLKEIIVSELTVLMIQGMDPGIRSTALDTLIWFGLKASPAVPSLIRILDQREFEVLSEDEVVDALERITDEEYGSNTKRWKSWWQSNQ
jgi:hypothetical protein